MLHEFALELKHILQQDLTVDKGHELWAGDFDELTQALVELVCVIVDRGVHVGLLLPLGFADLNNHAQLEKESEERQKIADWRCKVLPRHEECDMMFFGFCALII